MTSLKLAKALAKIVADKKAQDISIMDMRKVANFCDFFVLCTGTSSRHVQAIATGVEESSEELNLTIRAREGFKEGRWVLVDLVNVVVHVFDRETREFYGLEYLWQEAKTIKTGL